MSFDRQASEQAICERLGKLSRGLLTEEAKLAFVARYGLPWWLPPLPQYLAVCPTRFMPPKEALP